MASAPRYEIVDTLATGDFAVVYRARDRELGREVAIKQIHQQFRNDPRQLERYWREAQILASLQHPNVLTVYDIVRSQGWLILELMRGNLGQMLAAGPVDLDFLRFTMVCGLNALSFLHANGVIHGDIKPSNLLVDAQNRVKIGDFGLARRASNEQGSLLKGTTKYMAPELVSDQFGQVGPASDLYSLGFSAYEMMCGPQFEQLFPGLATFGKDRQIAWLMWHAAADRHLPEISRVLEGVPADLARVIQRLSSKDPAQRYASAKEALRDLRSGSTPAPQVEAAPAEEPAPPGKRLVRMGAIAAFAVSLLLSVWMVWPKSEPAAPVAAGNPEAGVLEGVFPDERRLVLRTAEDKPLEIQLSPVDKFYINGKESLLRELAKADRVETEWLRDASGKRFREVRATRPQHEEGRIRALDVASGKLTLAQGEPERTTEIRIPRTAKLSFNGLDKLQGRAVELADLKVGDRVRVDHVGEELGGRAAVAVDAQREVTLEGTLRAIDVAKKKVTVETAEGAMQSLALAANCEVTINDRKVLDQKAVGTADLKPGDKVRVYHTTQVVRIDAHRVLGQTATVRVVGPNSLEVASEPDGKVSMLLVEKTCKITLAGESCELADLRPRDRVEVSHDTPSGTQLRALSIAAQRPADPARWALLIGVSAYDDSALAKAPHAAEDLRALAEVLSNRYAVPANQVLVLADPSLARLREAIPKFLDSVVAGQSLIVYIQCAAVKGPSGAYFLAPKECNHAQPEATGIALQAVVDRLEANPAKDKLLLLDTGYGPGEPSAEELFQSLATPSGMAALRTVTGIAGSSKSQQSQPAPDGKRGLFALELAQGYSGRADANRDNRLEPTELFAYLKTAMASAAAKDRPQTPAILLPDNRPPRLADEAKKLIRAMTAALRQTEAKLSESRLQYDAAAALAGKEPEPKMVFGLIAMRIRNRNEAQRQFDELRGSHPAAFVPVMGSAWLRFDRKQYPAGVADLTELAGKLPKAVPPGGKLPEISDQVAEWIGQLREYLPVGDERKAVAADALEKLDAAVAALGPTAAAAYDKGRQHARGVAQKFDADIEAAPNDNERVRLRYARLQLNQYTAFPYDAVSRYIIDGLDK